MADALAAKAHRWMRDPCQAEQGVAPLVFTAPCRSVLFRGLVFRGYGVPSALRIAVVRSAAENGFQITFGGAVGDVLPEADVFG